MRVHNNKDSGSLVSSRRKINKAGVSAKGDKEFPDVLHKYEPPDWEGALEELLKKLDEIGRRLLNSFSIYDLKDYKDTLRNFMKETNAKAYKLREETGWNRQGKHKSYQLIELIDHELEELSRMVISKQKDQLKLVEKLDTIRGLLVDLYS